MYAVALLLMLAPIQGERYGHTDAQILKMGREKWYEFATTKDGSTAGMCDAESTFGEVLHRRNAPLLAKSPSKAAITKLHKLLVVFRNSIIDAGYATSGGGTMWNPVYAATAADVEEVVATLVGKPLSLKPAPKMTTSMVTQALANQIKLVTENRKEIDDMQSSAGGYKAAMKGLNDAKATLPSIFAIASKRRRAESDAILQFCKNSIETMSSMTGPN